MLRISRYRQRGVTLLEFVVAAAILGGASIILSGAMGTFKTMQERAYLERQLAINNLIAEAMLDYADTPHALLPEEGVTGKNFIRGVLPTPTIAALPDGRTQRRIIVSPTATTSMQTLMPYLIGKGFPANQLLSDGRKNGRVRTYLKVSHGNGVLYESIPFMGSGQVRMHYEVGVVYLPACRQADSCATSPSWSNSINASNVSTWAPSPDSLATVHFSTRSSQRRWVKVYEEQVVELAQALTLYFKKSAEAAPAAPTNWFPGTALPVMDPLTNKGCRTPWVNLEMDPDILAAVGLSRKYATNPWGSPVFYCRDYDPSGTKGADTRPHFGALAIKKNLWDSLYDPAADLFDEQLFIPL